MQHDIGYRLKLLRVERGLTLREAAKRAGVATNTVLYIEQGGHRPYDVTVAKLAKAYGVPASDLIGPAPAKQQGDARVAVEVA